MRKVLSNLICLFIPSKLMRRRVRACLMEFNPAADRHNLAEFLGADVPEKCVLMVEPSITHGELAPGFAKYWLDLGYHVHALLHDRVAGDNPFCRFNHERLRLFRHSYCCYEKFLSGPRVAKYRHVFFSTPAYARWTRDGQKYSLHDCTQSFSMNGSDVFLVEHRLDDIDAYLERDFLQKARLVTLAEFAWAGQTTLMVNPHFYGDIRVTPKNDRVNFIVVGAVDEKRKNHTLLRAAAQGLARD